MPKKGRNQKEEDVDMDVDVDEEEEVQSKGKKGGKEAPKKGKQAKKGKESDEEEEEKPQQKGKGKKGKKGDSDDEEDVPQQKGKQSKGKKGKQADSEEEEEQPKGKQQKGKQQKKGNKNESEDEEEPQSKSKQSKKKGGKNDESDEEEEVPKKGGKQGNKKGGKKVESEDEEPAPKKGGKQQKKGNKKDDSEEEEEPVQKGKQANKKGAKKVESEEEEEEKPQKGGKQANKKGAKKVESEDEEEEKPQKGGKKANKKGAKKVESEEEEEEKPQKGGKQANKKGAKKVESEDEESEEEPVPKKGGKQQKKKGKNEDSEEEEKPVQKGKQANKKGKKAESDDEEDEKPVQKGKQAGKKGAKKVESEEEESEEEEEEEESEEEVAPKKGGKAQPPKKNAPKKEEDEEPVAAAGMVSKKNKKNKKKGARKADSDSEPEVKTGGGFAGLDDEDEEEGASVPASKKNKKKGKQAPKSGGGFAGLDVDDEEDDEAPAPKANKKGGKSAGGFADLEVEDEEPDVTSKMASLSIEKKKKEPREPKIIKTAGDLRSKKQIREERKKAQRQADQPKEEAREKTQEELEEEALERYNLAQTLKGREAPSYVHLRNSEETRSKLGNDIKVDNYTLQVPGRTLLTDASFTLAYGHHYGFIGRNGLGKSTLLQKIADRDGIQIASHLRVLYVEQEVPGDDTTPIEYVLRADVEREWLLQEEKTLTKLEIEDPYWMDNPEEKRSYGLKEIQERLRDIESEKAVSRGSAILVGLGFDSEEIKTKPSREFSGGWRMRISLARALFCRPEVLLLDEPTNHLDLHACFWLEKYLSKWKSTLLVVSHEATFLNEIVDHILEIRNKQLTTYRGDYWTYQKTREINDRTKLKKKDKNDKEKARLREVIQRTAGKSGASGKDKKLASIEDITIERDDPSLKVSFPEPDVLPPPIYQFQDVSFGYDPNKLLFKNLEFGVDMDSRIALVGLNGVGKSTLMKLMAGELKETSGYISRNRKCRIARFSQHSLEQLNPNLTPAEYLDSKFNIGSEHALRQHLGRFGITGNLALNKIETLSGGQKSRVVLAELAWAEPHILFLDEPSNHLDLDAIEALAQGLNNFGGGVVLISHNQRLISLVCNEIWVVTKAGTVDRFNGEFDDYKEDILAHMDFEGDSESEDEHVVREREKELKKAKKAEKEERDMEKTDRKKGGGKKKAK